MSPGPSLAVVVQNTVKGDQLQGVLTAWAHATGIAIYALLTATGLAVIITSNDVLFRIVQWSGAVFLVYLGIKTLRSGPDAANRLQVDTDNHGDKNHGRGISEGFLIAFLNPKIAVFFIALFSQFVRVDAGWEEKAILTATAGVIDGLWYTLVVLMLSRGPILEKLRTRAVIFDRVFGVLLIAIAIPVIF